MLVLFDIDGTLLDDRGTARGAIVHAGRGLFGDAFTADGTDFAGRLDTLIIRDLLVASGIVPRDEAERLAEAEAAVRSAYAERLGAIYAERTAVGGAHDAEASTALPGVLELVDALHADPGVHLGIVTGNYPETGTMKIRSAGLAPERFVANAWGSDGGHRRELPPRAIARLVEATGRRVAGEEVVVIGDTPHDVDCARANGCRVIAVGTGPSYTEAQLREAGPDHYVADLADVGAIHRWILGAA